MADPRAELEELRRLDELEKRAFPSPQMQNLRMPQFNVTGDMKADKEAYGKFIGTEGLTASEREVAHKKMLSSYGWGTGIPKLAYDVGGTVTDKTGSPALGYAANVATQAIPNLAASFRTPGAPEQSITQWPAEALMRKAIKPSTTENPANVTRAINTALEEGLDPRYGSMQKASGINRALDQDVTNILAPSTKTANISDITSRLSGLKGRTAVQANPQADLAAIQKVEDDFLNSQSVAPAVKSARDEISSRASAVEQAKDARISALRDVGRFQTFAAQQENLAHGGTLGGNASPSAFPVPGMPRLSGRYSENIQRVPEGLSAAEETAAIAGNRGQQLSEAEQALRWASGQEPKIPVQLAHELKKGTYAALGGKQYGEMGSASSEAQKQLARGMREVVMEAEPAVVEPLKRQASIQNWREIVGNAAAREGNKDLLGISVAASNPQTMAASMMDRLGIAKSLAARGLYTAGKPSVALPIAMTADEKMQTDKQRMIEYLKQRAAEQGAQ